MRLVKRMAVGAVVATVCAFALYGLLATPASAVRSTVTHTAVNVAVTSTTTLAANINRNFVILQNNSDTNIYCKFNVAAVVNEGIRLNANGGTMMLDATFPTTAIYCIHGGSGSKVALVTEGIQ